MKRNITVIILLSLLLALLMLPVQAAELGYVTDAAGLLTDEEQGALETLCGQISDQYDCGVYAVTVEDYRELGASDVYTAAYSIYHEYVLGKGADRNGLILLLSMEERDYALFVYGRDAEYAFSGYGQKALEERFLPLFGRNDWYGGFQAYAEGCGEFLAQAVAGAPVRKDPGRLIIWFVLGSFVIALVVVSILRSGMKNVRKQTRAGDYINGKLNLTRKYDQFTHMTQSRTKIESNGSSSARSGGGGSGRAGKF